MKINNTPSRGFPMTLQHYDCAPRNDRGIINTNHQHLYRMISPLLFEPITCALVACALEHTIVRHRPLDLPRMRVWIRRHAECIMDATLEEFAQPMLEAVPCIHLKIIMLSSFFLIFFCVLRHQIMQYVPTSHHRQTADQRPKL